MTSSSTWLPCQPKSHFSIANLPFGIVQYGANRPRVAVAIGEYALDLSVYSTAERIPVPEELQQHQTCFAQSTLNDFAALGRLTTSAVRLALQVVLSSGPSDRYVGERDALRAHFESVEPSHGETRFFVPLASVQMRTPFAIGDYTDFYVGLHHAMNCGRLLRGPGQELQPNYRHLPVGYHGRASSIVVSGTSVTRPSGQVLDDPSTPLPTFDASRKLDFELELGCFVQTANEIGQPVSVDDAYDSHLFGVVLLNDWSARDIQSWEMVPLGPLNSKNFATTISPWVVTMDALKPFLQPTLEPDRPLLGYLRAAHGAMIPNINLEVSIKTRSGLVATIARTSSQHLLFSFAQMLAHHTVGGCPFRTGDLLGSGTISGSTNGSFGSLFEQTNGGKTSISIQGESRTFLQDGDTVTMSGVCGDEEYAHVGFGDCTGTISPAIHFDF